ncbi:S8/S53 family peptidase [Jannaschia ovalis]|uniref:Subtilase family protein n=1 Tax=Jannaschia ovalis TaxID=3038773 RepID=A0ABY8LGR5_9RHOB|nr:hypothetical protein [Jannaschia sp. GRR-S6-38]WGH79593.1 hypothetical protein P8627_04840 [Jannaschia sp. GRR-S6-38]
MAQWGDSTSIPGRRSLYAAWWADREGRLPRNANAFVQPDDLRGDYGPYLFRDATFRGLSRYLADRDGSQPRIYSELDVQVPIPGHALNTDWESGTDWLTLAMEAIPPLDADTVILGIIDTGIPLGHRRFRLADGGTRVLASWQQSATWQSGPGSPGQPFLPFGRELASAEIDGLLAAATRDGRLDEDGFNRAAGLVEPHLPTGHRDLDRRASHGAHVLDLAGGIDAAAEPEWARRLRIIAVNLPPQFLHGPAGDYLQFYAAWGMRRIQGLADALWRRDHEDAAPGAFPVALNMSYGMQAGPKDGSMPLEILIRALTALREPAQGDPAEQRKPPIRIQMPAGNSNLYRCAARLALHPDDPRSLNWRIQPADQTSNHVEIWTPPYDSSDRLDPADFAIALAEPGAAPQWAAAPVPGQSVSFGPYSEFACVEHEVVPGGPTRRLVFLIRVAQTFAVDPAAGALAPAGLWRILMTGPAGLEVDLFVQSDQSFVLQSPIGRRSYFDDPAYRTHLETGRLADSFGYADGTPEPGGGPVSRRGTHNALGAGPEIATIAGYRLTDGRPALYSSSGWSDGPPSQITAAYPSEDGAAHPGLLAAGSAAGSVVSFSGTSMATALATREVALGMLNWGGGWSDAGLFDADAIAAGAAMDEAQVPAQWRPVPAFKAGAGRAAPPDRLRARRIARP